MLHLKTFVLLGFGAFSLAGTAFSVQYGVSKPEIEKDKLRQDKEKKEKSSEKGRKNSEKNLKD